MRAILILAVIALLMGLAGWMTIDSDTGRTSINFETEKIQQDTENAVDNAESMIESGADAISDNDEVDERPVVVDPSSADVDINVRSDNHSTTVTP
jgi:arsenate reductase-like glutaredoxin family protein